MDVLIIKGTAGSGKSETSIAFSRYFHKGVRIEIDNIRAMVISPDWLNHEEHYNILGLAAKMVGEFLKLDFNPIIVVDTFGKDKIKAFTKELQNIKENIAIKVIGLYVNDEELKRRIDNRPNTMFKDFEYSKLFNDEMIHNKDENEILIDTTYQTPEKTALKIYDIIRGQPTAPISAGTSDSPCASR